MKNILNFLKKNRFPIPINIGLILGKIPYNRRPGIGKIYRQQQLAVRSFPLLPEMEKQEYVYGQFMKIFRHAYDNVKFYNELYKKHGILPNDIKSFDDIGKIPIITKQDLVKYDLEDRSYPVKNRLLVNTGGSSGKSFAFYMDPLRYGNEWAHIHDMWGRYGYSQSDLKLSFDGRVKRNNEIVYDFARNSLLFDIYADPDIISKQLISFIKKYPIKYLHGYPSAIYEFALYCETNNTLLELLKKQLKAAFLSSEFPSPHYRNKIEQVFQISTQSFYGHTETCVMAVEGEKFVYEAYQTYGYAEAVPFENKYHLVGTSYFNFASPLIRYDTSDLIEPANEDTMLSKFTIKEGRSGEFIIDKNNKKIPITGLIYGRHHELFNVCEHIQVYQQAPGKAVIFYVTKIELRKEAAIKMFDNRLIEIDFEFVQIEKPFLTASGKTNLLINSIPENCLRDSRISK